MSLNDKVNSQGPDGKSEGQRPDSGADLTTYRAIWFNRLLKVREGFML